MCNFSVIADRRCLLYALVLEFSRDCSIVTIVILFCGCGVEFESAIVFIRLAGLRKPMRFTGDRRFSPISIDVQRPLCRRFSPTGRPEYFSTLVQSRRDNVLITSDRRRARPTGNCFVNGLSGCLGTIKFNVTIRDYTYISLKPNDPP